MTGGWEHYGWGRDRYLMADIFDALTFNTRATGMWGKKGPPDLPTYPRPKAEAKEPKKKATVADIYARFTRR